MKKLKTFHHLFLECICVSLKKKSKTGPHTSWGGRERLRKRHITPDWWVSDLMSEVISKRLNPKHWFFREGIHQLLNLILWAQHPQRASLTVCKTILLHNLSSWNQFIEQSQLGGKWLSCFLQPLPSNIFISWPSFQADPVASRFLQVYEGIPLHSWQLPCRDWRGLVQAKSHETSSPIPGLSPNTLNRAATW